MSLNRQFSEIKFPTNTIFLCYREIKDLQNVPRKFLRNLSPTKIKENRVVKMTRASTVKPRYFEVPREMEKSSK